MKTTKILFAALFCACASRPLTASLSTGSSPAQPAPPRLDTDNMPKTELIRLVDDVTGDIIRAFAAQASSLEPIKKYDMVQIEKLIKAYIGSDLSNTLHRMCTLTKTQIGGHFRVMDAFKASGLTSKKERHAAWGSFKKIADGTKLNEICWRIYDEYHSDITNESNFYRYFDLFDFDHRINKLTERQYVHILFNFLKSVVNLRSPEGAADKAAMQLILETCYPIYQLLYAAGHCSGDKYKEQFKPCLAIKNMPHIYLSRKALKQLHGEMIQVDDEVLKWKQRFNYPMFILEGKDDIAHAPVMKRHRNRFTNASPRKIAFFRHLDRKNPASSE